MAFLEMKMGELRSIGENSSSYRVAMRTGILDYGFVCASVQLTPVFPIEGTGDDAG